MNRICPKCNQLFKVGDQIHRRELHESEVGVVGEEPNSWVPTEGPWIHDDCEPWPEIK